MHNIHVNSHRRGKSFVNGYVRHGRTVNPNKKYKRVVIKKIPPRLDFPDEVGQMPNTPGIYAHYNNNNRALYVGSTKNLRKRAQSYYEKDRSHPTKTKLRPNISKIGYKQMRIQQARLLEQNLKDHTVYNYD